MQTGELGAWTYGIQENAVPDLSYLPRSPSSSTAPPALSWVRTTSQCTFCIDCLETKTVSATQTQPVDQKEKVAVIMSL